MSKIKIGYFADGPWSHLAFEKIIHDPDIDIKFIVPRNDTKDKTLKNYSHKYNIDYLFPVNINSDEMLLFELVDSKEQIVNILKKFYNNKKYAPNF